MKPVNWALLPMPLLHTTTLMATACTASDSRETSVALDGPALGIFYTDN